MAFSVLPWPEGEKGRIWSILDSGGDPRLPKEWREALHQLRPDQFREEAHRRGARLWLPGDDSTLEALLKPLPYPVALWTLGSLPPPAALAMVGTREPDEPGLTMARNLAKELTQAGLGILSGLALGIDGAAHEGALQVGTTWGVLGSGLDHPYPKAHQGLMKRIQESGGGVITPFPPDAQPLRWHFPKRNFLLAAWTLGTLVVQGRERSGSMVTARLALDLGKELWAVPGFPNQALSAGPNALLREGAARLCRGSLDVLQDLALLSKDLTKGVHSSFR